MNSKPTVLVTACNTSLHVPGWGDLAHQSVFDRYLRFVSSECGALPLILPAIPVADAVLRSLLQDVDGVLLTGAASNVHPRHYGAEPRSHHFDEQRDESSLHLIRVAFGMDLPLLGICRGLQEINVAFGGSLCQAVHETEGRMDHRSRSAPTIAQRYVPAHPITAVAGGWLATRLVQAGHADQALHVNSAHGQAVDVLGAGLQPEAFALDGTVEALRATAATCVVGVQWHIEWMENCAASRVVGEDFKAALQARHQRRRASLASEEAFHA
ncbi:putative glutamine amidotransferase [Roseateles sp. YR242]|uniref:gamma-glutamyl-gamma-aminobutyrate hydrolase family protein n=1 Tax=Roseateles sp. YR242 TaxID=1855305 RepID=UPI0008C9E0D6|nr:gamma-glutamyl-gamma-aminobutyrate hydrolase family protein [Roseateles sp. YR242]SEL52432.1 putative glutamine amidotransferase [Roseateles sp. YR242]